MHVFAKNSRTNNAVCVGAFKVIFLIHCDTRWYEFFVNYPSRIEKNDEHFLDLLFAHAELFVLETVACAIPHSSLGFTVVFGRSTFVACYDPIKKHWFSFEQFKHFCRHFISTPLFDRRSNFWNHLCTHFSHVQILCNNLVWTVHSLSSSAIFRIVKRRS
jgi:hypothetical protein